MRRLASIASALTFCCILVSAGVVGVFQGRVVLRKSAPAEAGILYVESRHGMARKVRVTDAVIEYDEDVPKAQRKRTAAESLCDNALVRVTAEQSEQEDGPWRAISILILPEPKRNGIAPGQKFSFLGAMPGSNGAEAQKQKPEAGDPPRAAGTNGSCWAK